MAQAAAKPAPTWLRVVRAVGLVLGVLLALAPVVYLAVQWGKDGFGPLVGDPTFAAAFPRWTSYVMAWTWGAATACWTFGRGRAAHQAAGLGLMAVPVWDTLWGILASIVPLVQGGFVFRPYTRYQLSSLYSSKVLADLGYLGAGFLLYAAPRVRDVVHQTPRRLAARLATVGLPMGAFAHFGEGRSILAGLALFPGLLVASIGLSAALSSVEELNQSDETSLFDNMTVFHAILISLAAGFGEELVYRGILLLAVLAVFARIARGRGGRWALAAGTGASIVAAAGLVMASVGPAQLPWWSAPAALTVGLACARLTLVWGAIVPAILAQAVVFGFAHSGYGTWSHVLLPIGFALFAGVVAWVFGLWAAITLHVLVDLFAFGAAASANADWVASALTYGFLLNVVFSLVAAVLFVAWLVRLAELQRIAPRW